MQPAKKMQRFILVMTICVGLAIIGQWLAIQKSFEDHSESSELSSRANLRMRSAQRMQVNLSKAAIGQFGFLLTEDSDYLEWFELGVGMSAFDAAELARFQPTSPYPEIEELDRQRTTVITELRTQIRLAHAKGFEAARHAIRSEPFKNAMTKIEDLIGGMIAKDQDLLEVADRKLIDARWVRALTWSIGSAVVVLGLAIGFAGLWRSARFNESLVEKLGHESRHDGLTGLANLTLFRETLDYMLIVARRRDLKPAVLYLDLNGFKSINDELGHDKGNIALIEVAKALTRVLRDGDFVARIGGDEFAVLLPSVEGEGTQTHGRIHAAIAALSPPALRGHRMDCSIGLAIYPEDGETADQLIKKADERMFEQKNAK